MTDSPYIDDADQPYTHNPIRNLPWIDTKTEVTVFQYRPTLENQLAEFCGGTVAVVDGQLVVLVPDPGGDENIRLRAHLGDYVVTDGEKFWVEAADGFNQRYWPVGRDPGWSHRCYMDWEAKQ